MLIIRGIFLRVFCILLLFCSIFLTAMSSFPKISAQAAVLLQNEQLLYEKNGQLHLPMASTTKLMTAILALENLELSERIPIRREYCQVEGSSMYLQPGTERTAEELVQGLLLVSGNDAALALACHMAGSVDAFAREMNRKASALGLRNTHFTNPHGLSEEAHYSTAYDLAKLMVHCMENEEFSRIIKQKSFVSEGVTLYNHNRLLSECKGCVGGKTGYTMAAGRCLVSVCRREGVQTVCVTLNAPDDWQDHQALYDWCYANYSPRWITDGLHFRVPVLSGRDECVPVEPEQPICLFLPDSALLRLEIQLPWQVFLPIEKGEEAGSLSIYIDERLAGEYDLLYSETKSDKQGARP